MYPVIAFAKSSFKGVPKVLFHNIKIYLSVLISFTSLISIRNNCNNKQSVVLNLPKYQQWMTHSVVMDSNFLDIFLEVDLFYYDCFVLFSNFTENYLKITTKTYLTFFRFLDFQTSKNLRKSFLRSIIILIFPIGPFFDSKCCSQ